MDNLNDGHLAGGHVRGAANIALIDGVFLMRVSGGDRRSGNAEHRGDRYYHREYPHRPKGSGDQSRHTQ
jgi:hypothetical protein